jgi:putative heme-binding domain-containing protein
MHLLAIALGAWLAAQAAPEAPRFPGLPRLAGNAARQAARLFQAHCAPCHGPGGEGGRGPTLLRPKLPRAPDDKALFDLVKGGIPGSEMPGAWGLSDGEALLAAAFARSLGQGAPAEPVAGSASHGEEVYRKADCARCHMIQGKGGRLGPELTEIGARRSAAHLRRSIVDPEAEVPQMSFLDADLSATTDSFLLVNLVTRSGENVRGVRVNEDPFSIQVRDLSDRLRSYWKSELLKLEREPGKSPMPSYRGSGTDAELDDLVAYLLSLRGTR